MALLYAYDGSMLLPEARHVTNLALNPSFKLNLCHRLMLIDIYTSHLMLALLTQGVTSNSTDGGMFKYDVNIADVTLRGNRALLIQTPLVLLPHSFSFLLQPSTEKI